MKFFSQKDPRWANINIGNTNYKLKDFGCLICCWAMVTELEPPVIAYRNNIFNTSGVLVYPSQLA